MRRLTLALSAVLLATAFASFVLFFSAPEARSQDQAAESQNPRASTQEGIRQTAPSEEAYFNETAVSQGTAGVQTASKMLLRAVAKDLAEEERLPDYSQVVDNDTEGRFKAPGWEERSDSYSYGGDYAYAAGGTEAKAARFKVNIPTAGDYAVYAWWPAARENNASTRFGVRTAFGMKWTKVNQQRDGGMWVKLGTYEMKAGDRYAVWVSPQGGFGVVVADAVVVVRGAASPPPDGEQASGGEQLYSASSVRPNGHDIVRVARWHIGTPYRLSPPYPCRAYKMEDCSCHTRLVFLKFDRRLPDDPVRQWNHGRWIARSNLRPGDLVFFKENGPSKPITHVGIYSGNGYLVHASSYFHKVVESKMRYIHGYFGAKRIRPL